MPDFSVPSPVPLTLGDAILGGLNSRQDLRAKSLANQTAQTNLNTLDALNRARVSWIQSRDVGQQIQNKGNSTLTDLLRPQMQAGIANTQAQTNLSNAQANYFPFSAKGGYYGAIAKMAQGQAASDRVALLYYMSPQGQNVLKNSPQDQQAFASIMARQRANAPGGIFGQMGGNPMQPNNSQAPAAAPTAQPAPQITPSNAFPNGANNPNIPANQQPLDLNSNQINNLQNKFGDNNVKSIQEAAENSVLHRNLTTLQRNQIVRANSADKVFNQVAPLMPSIVKFAGLAGKAKTSVEAARASLGIPDSDPDYQNYLVATHEKLPAAAQELVKAFGFGMTDAQKEDAKNLTQPDWVDKNPQQALALYNGLIEAANAIEGEIAKNPKDAMAQLNKNVANPPFAIDPMISVLDSNGHSGKIPRGNLQAALQGGFTVKVKK